MSLDGASTYNQSLCNLVVRPAVGNMLEYLLLPGSQDGSVSRKWRNQSSDGQRLPFLVTDQVHTHLDAEDRAVSVEAAVRPYGISLG